MKMKQVIENELKKIIEYSKKNDVEISQETAFDYLAVQYYCYQSNHIEEIWYDIKDNNLTDGKNDGGIDFVFFDDENGKVVIGQNKLSTNIDKNAAVAELQKTLKTIEDFDKKNVQSYNQSLRRNVQNALDRLTDETIGNIEIVFFHLSSFNDKKVKEKIEDQSAVSNIEFMDETALEELILKIKSEIQLVKEHKFNLDGSKNFLSYENDDKQGAIVNISSHSLIEAYNKYNSEGLFNLNIRRYIRSKSVDDGINQTLNKKRDNFWFLNNGLTIACDDYQIDGNVLKLFDFSIVNGGQTTTLISKYDGSNREEFFIPCKIVKSINKLNDEDRMVFFNDIAEATNSQKPIQPRDLKSNSPEMLQLQQLLLDKKIYLEIKRGSKQPRNTDKKIKNDDLAQILFSFVNQKPGTARSNKKGLFSVNKNYMAIFRKNYVKDPKQAAFLYDLIELNNRFDSISKSLKSNSENALTAEEMNVFSNGKMAIFAILGLFYRLVNRDLERSELLNTPNLVEEIDFNYASFISNYKSDDINTLLIDLIIEITQYLSECYHKEFDNQKATSVSNFFKTDKKYTDKIIPHVVKEYRTDRKWKAFLDEYGELFLRA